MVAHPGHIRHSGAERLNLLHETVPLGLVPCGVREIARVQDEIDSGPTLSCQPLADVHGRVHRRRLLPVVLRAILVRLAHVGGDDDRQGAAVRAGWLRCGKGPLTTPSVLIGAHTVKYAGGGSAVLGEWKHSLVEVARMMPARFVCREAAEIRGCVCVGHRRYIIVEASRLCTVHDLVGTILLRRRPRHLHFINARRARQPKVHRGVSISHDDRLGNRQDFEAYGAIESACKEYPIDGSAHIRHEKGVGARSKLCPRNEFVGCWLSEGWRALGRDAMRFGIISHANIIHAEHGWRKLADPKRLCLMRLHRPPVNAIIVLSKLDFHRMGSRKIRA
mmetsp:Transcript_45166/g.118528  ORF Transcript_45166/g.118528 Transcript_45166/m.118528 type:complete len:334 (+) Transcript_45166:1419-2420(+)